MCYIQDNQISKNSGGVVFRNPASKSRNCNVRILLRRQDKEWDWGKGGKTGIRSSVPHALTADGNQFVTPTTLTLKCGLQSLYLGECYNPVGIIVGENSDSHVTTDANLCSPFWILQLDSEGFFFFWNCVVQDVYCYYCFFVARFKYQFT